MGLLRLEAKNHSHIMLLQLEVRTALLLFGLLQVLVLSLWPSISLLKVLWIYLGMFVLPRKCGTYYVRFAYLFFELDYLIILLSLFFLFIIFHFLFLGTGLLMDIHFLPVPWMGPWLLSILK